MDRYRALTDKVDRFFLRVIERHGDDMQCRAGCSDCCVAGLTVTAVEADAIRAFLAEQGTRSKEQGAENACPALTFDGRCSIYPVRPIVCRSHGLPIRIDGDVTSCSKNFRRTTPAADCVLDQTTLSTIVAAVNQPGQPRVALTDLLRERPGPSSDP